MSTQQKFLNKQTQTLYEKFLQKWSSCSLCPLHEKASNYIFFQGTLPSEVLFIGEHPNVIDDLIGTPYSGQNGKLLKDLIKEVQNKLGFQFTYSITTLISCTPFNETNTIRTPTKTELTSCNPRLQEFVTITNPKTLIFLGKASKHHRYFKHYHSLLLDDPNTFLKQKAQGRQRQLTLTYKRWILSIISFLESNLTS